MRLFRSLRRIVRRPWSSRSGTPRAQDELRRLTERFVAADTVSLQIRRATLLFSFLWQARRRRSSLNRLVRWIRLLEYDSVLRQGFQRSWFGMLTTVESVSLLAESGLPRHSALSAEVMRRLFQRLLPSARPEHDAGRLFAGIFTSQRAVDGFFHQQTFLLERLGRLLWPADDPGFMVRLHEEVREALCLLATRVAGRGATEAMRHRSSAQTVQESPFYVIVFETREMVSAGAGAPQMERWEEAVARCRDELNQVHLHMEDAGVSSALVFDLRSIDASLDRMQLLMAFLALESIAKTEARAALPGRNLLRALVRGRFEDTRLSSLFQQNLNLLARKTVERTGRGGEHYIAHSQREYAAMWRAAAGGGLLTVFTAALKMRVLEAHLPLFVEGLAISLDYSVSFVLLQIFGLALATKQPSMTAATLAGIVRGNRGDARYSKIAEFAADISRTQLAAAVGNVITVSLGAVAFEFVWRRMFKTHYLPVASAEHVYQTLHPFTSGTALFAAFTGVLLWMAAMIGGWCENFVVYHRVPEAIRQHPLGHRMGVRRLHRMAEWMERNIASYSTSISLGLLLGFAPVLARFFGIPLDVRHVTLSTGTLALAAARFGVSSLGHGWFYSAVAGLAITFVLNLGVSFSIASIVALRAYDIPREEQLRILKYILVDFLQSPLEFIVPAKPDIMTIAGREQALGQEASGEHS